MILLILYLFIHFSSSILNENDQDADNIGNDHENNLEKENNNDFLEIPPTMANTHEVYEAWIKRKLEIHRKIAELEAIHNEEEVEEEDDEYKRKIEKILDEELDKNKFYREFEQKRKKSLEEIQDQEEATNREKENSILNNIQKFNDVAKRLHHEIIKNPQTQNSVLNEKQYEKKNNDEQSRNMQNNINNRNKDALHGSNKVNQDLDHPTITLSQETAKIIYNSDDEEKNNSEQIAAPKIKLDFLCFLIPISILIIIILLYIAFSKQIQRWLRHKKSDELPNSLKYN